MVSTTHYSLNVVSLKWPQFGERWTECTFHGEGWRACLPGSSGSSLQVSQQSRPLLWMTSSNTPPLLMGSYSPTCLLFCNVAWPVSKGFYCHGSFMAIWLPWRQMPQQQYKQMQKEVKIKIMTSKISHNFFPTKRLMTTSSRWSPWTKKRQRGSDLQVCKCSISLNISKVVICWSFIYSFWEQPCVPHSLTNAWHFS